MTTARMESYQGCRAERRTVHVAAFPEPNQGTGCSDSRRHSKHWGDVCMSEIEDWWIVGAHSVKICAMLYNSSGKKYAVDVDYFGFEVAHPFWVGYGLDYKGTDRTCLTSACSNTRSIRSSRWARQSEIDALRCPTVPPTASCPLGS